MIRLYNTKTRIQEDLKPINEGVVSLYTCGPTVYDYPHIGNWYAFIRWDVLTRTLRSSDYNVNWVMNITDVGHLVSDADDGEDKLEKGAKREGKTARDVAKYYGDYFIKGLARLNFSQVSALPKATEYIAKQIDFVKKLDEKGYTYLIDDGVYFDTSKLDDYGKLAKLNIETLKAGARVELNPQKKNATDFALWKLSPKNTTRDMEWDSPWGKGFPGWHLECSVMSLDILGEVDIHGGGIDHIPVHHTNELAQNEAYTGKDCVNVWVHSNFVKVDGQKMSKSLGNLITLEDIEKKGFGLEAFRVLVLESHYRSEAQFTWDTMQAAQNRLNNYRAMAQMRYQPFIGPVEVDFADASDKILNELRNDLNTPQALAVLSEVANSVIANGISVTKASEFESFLKTIDSLLGLKLNQEPDITNKQKKLIEERQSAREQKNWQQSDKFRDQLKKDHIELRDTDAHQIWSRQG